MKMMTNFSMIERYVANESWRNANYQKHYRRNDPCVYCGNVIASTWDHLVPKSRGGTDTASNMERACAACNQDKGSGLPLQYLATRHLLKHERWKLFADPELVEYVESKAAQKKSN